ncbi:MAG: hypothetical protein QF362_01110 [Candidatus Woesearchaeota archaeon]|jgi:hypothetical protein|nr:hypothetical protein [Candidatus Woesearchaeota archaeon]MDP7506028.1 hypothetical protein [Candidatus Woesearchaeota archaeon]|tara:strand:- start:167 stop:379 length:213 start_codon:yes stop_codon:yes gene_type:complete
METQLIKQIADDMSFIKKDIILIKKHMVDVDSILSKDEELLLKKAREEHKEGETVSLKELEKELSEDVHS